MCAALRPLQACPLSGGKFRFPSRAIPCPKSLPLQARLGLLFLFLPFFCPFVLPPAWRGWLSLIQVRRCSGFAHSWVTLAQQGLSGVSLVSFLYSARKIAHRPSQGRVWFHRLFFPAFLGGSPANSRYAYTAISPALNPRMKISLGRKDPPCRGFLLPVLLIFSAGLLPIFRIPFCEAFSLFTPPQFLRWPIPRFWVSKRPGAILALA